ncbi:hypothetical protein EST38_g5148 [Candolleomyces aberdarensis]|uniref:DUF2415 domain-containing protein n=1 Tax=Candolleomyces aberdarensis TaxID=2316362 RepID=A0A4Q2DL92_9AGAR|nr:hypothetical protein EST38_g5148 [Candolleomyces aberdarensis]
MQRSRHLTPKPTAIGQGQLNIDHPQLRDLVVCPHERGVMSFLRDSDIVEQNLLAPGAPMRIVAELSFTPSSLTALPLGPNDEDTLYAAGGSWNADLHLSYHKGKSRGALWQKDTKLRGTLNNSVLLTKNHGSGVEPRVGVTNNDYTFRMYDCAVRTHGRGDASNGDEDEDEDDDGQMLECVGALALDNCVNYASISPSGRLLLSVGDSPNMYLHSVSGSSQLSFYPMATLSIPLPTNTPPHYPTIRPSTFTASFATAFSSDSMHFAVGSQEGVVAVWDIRKVSQPMKVWQVDKMRGMGVGGLGAASGFISWDPSDWFNSRAPAWSVRNVKFVGGNRPDGKECLVFTEHTNLMHIMNARTFEEEDIVRIPTRMADPQPPTPPMYPTDPDFESLNSPLSYIQLGLPASAFSAGPAHTLGTGKQPGWEWAQLEDEENGLQPLALEDIIHGFSEESASDDGEAAEGEPVLFPLVSAASNA